MYRLRLQESYTSAVTFEMPRFREALRKAREDTIGGRMKLAERTGLAASTIQSAEVGPDIPSIETIARFLDGCGLTLSKFFARIDGSQQSDSQGHSESETAVLKKGNREAHNSASPMTAGDADGAALRESPEVALDRIRFALREAGDVLFTAGVEELAGDDRSNHAVDSRTTRPDSRREGLHQTPARKRKRG